MSTEGSFDKLVQDLDDNALHGLSEALAREAAQRRQLNAVKLEDIGPNMTAADRLRVQEHIQRVLRGEE